MENRNTGTVVNSGTGVTGLLGVAFVTLKLIGIIDWSWWWVLSPFWIPLAFAILGITIAVVILGVVSLFE